MSWRGGIKRDKTDALFSYLVRERAEWTCEHCHRSFHGNRSRLHCSHIFTRGVRGLRWHPDNALAHCMGCHELLERNPLLFADHVREVKGRAVYDRLKVMASKPTKLNKWEKELIHSHLLAERKRIETLRAGGTRGRLEFTLP